MMKNIFSRFFTILILVSLLLQPVHQIHGQEIISNETIKELALAGITGKAQIDEIFNQTAVTNKDSKMYFFYKNIVDSKQYRLSRQALEEIYLIHSDKVIFTTQFNLFPFKEWRIYDQDKTGWKVIQTPSGSSSGQNEACIVGRLHSYPTSYYGCEMTFDLPQRLDYQATGINFYFTGGEKNNIGSVSATVNGKLVENQSEMIEHHQGPPYVVHFPVIPDLIENQIFNKLA